MQEIADNVKEKIKENGSVELSAYFRNNMIAQYNMDDIITVYDLLISDGKYLRIDTGNMHVFLMKPVIVKCYKKYGLSKAAEIIASAGLALLVGRLLQLKERQDPAQGYNEIKEQVDFPRRVIQKIDTGSKK